MSEKKQCIESLNCICQFQLYQIIFNQISKKICYKCKLYDCIYVRKTFLRKRIKNIYSKNVQIINYVKLY